MAESSGTSFSESTIQTSDGIALHFCSWKPDGRKPKATLLIVHGFAEYGLRYRGFCEYLARLGIASATFDVRGHGTSGGPRGYIKDWEDYFTDVETALKAVDEGGPEFILGHSMGGLLALDFVKNRKPNIRGLIISNPFLQLTKPAPKFKVWLGLTIGKFLPKFNVPGEDLSMGLSTDASIGAAYKSDPLVLKKINSNWFREVSVAQDRVKGYTELGPPLLFAYSDMDPIASPVANKKLVDQLACSDKTVVERKGELHEILNEAQKETLYKIIAEWMLSRVEMGS